MHMTWQAAMPGRKLLVLRPGVVFGPGEGGNVTRLVRSIVKGYFVYTGNKETRKAGGYIKELCNVFLFGIDYQTNGGEAVTLLNFSISHKLLLTLSYLVEGVAGLFGIKQPISPTRVRKLYRSTNIEARGLRELGYSYQYTLEGAFADWRQDKPEDFLPHVQSHLASGQFLCPLCCAHHSLDEGYAQSAFF
jgi:nucleoside-diphosphate-sugar epimerase